VVAGVVLLHALALSGLAGVGGGPTATAAAGPATTPVRTLRAPAAEDTGVAATGGRPGAPAQATAAPPTAPHAQPELAARPAPPATPRGSPVAAGAGTGLPATALPATAIAAIGTLPGAAPAETAPVPAGPDTPDPPGHTPALPPTPDAAATTAAPVPDTAPRAAAAPANPGTADAPAPAQAAPAAPATRRVPRYRASLPPAFEARFQMRRGLLAGQADWRFAPEGARYKLELHTQVLGREISHLRSEGQTAAAGLEPLRFVDGRRGRDQRAINFQRDAPGGGHISFSGPSTQLPLPVGVQDRLSWLLQLSAIVDADPALRQRGAEVSMWVVSPRGEADLWTFVVSGPEALAQPDGGRGTALALRRAPDRAFDTEVQVWLDPSAHHLPLRATWRNEGDSAAVDLRREALAWR
jgi:hypothetical protein